MDKQEERVFYNMAWAQAKGYCICGHEGWLASGPISERAKLHATAAFGLAIVMMSCPSYCKELKAPFLHAVKKLSREVRLDRAAPIWVFFERSNHDFCSAEGEEEEDEIKT